MVRFVVLLQFTQQGVGQVENSPARGEIFRQHVADAGGNVEFLFWTLGSVDGVLVLSAPDEETAVSLVLGLRQLGNVQTTMLRAYDAEEFAAIAAKIP